MNASKRYQKAKERYDNLRLAWTIGLCNVTRAEVRRALVAYERAKREYEKVQKSS